jgi:hypothetical protein
MGCCLGTETEKQAPEPTSNPVAKKAPADPKLAAMSKSNMGGGMKSAATAEDTGPDTSDIETATDRAVRVARKSKGSRERAGEKDNKFTEQAMMQKATG